MKKFIIGALLVILGLPGTALFFSNFVSLLIGGLPVLLILGGGLAVYLGWEDYQAQKELDEGDLPEPATAPAAADTIQKSEPAAETKILADPAEAPASKPPAKTGFVGNTDTMVFHSLSCNFAGGKKCTAKFTDRDEAVAAGYKPCKVCNP